MCVNITKYNRTERKNVKSCKQVSNIEPARRELELQKRPACVLINTEFALTRNQRQRN